MYERNIRNSEETDWTDNRSPHGQKQQYFT